MTSYSYYTKPIYTQQLSSFYQGRTPGSPVILMEIRWLDVSLPIGPNVRGAVSLVGAAGGRGSEPKMSPLEGP